MSAQNYVTVKAGEVDSLSKKGLDLVVQAVAAAICCAHFAHFPIGRVIPCSYLLHYSRLCLPCPHLCIETSQLHQL